jgi:acetyl esterase/lipase
VKILLSLLFAATALHAAPVTEKDISYYPEAALKDAGEYQKTMCKLDLRHPQGKTGFATVIWFHGGGLTGGQRAFPKIADPDIALVAAGYRLSPNAKLPEFIEDAAAATAWTLKNIGSYGGDPKKVFIAGHSAGGYLALMVGMDPQWLAPHGISIQSLAGLIPVSAQVTTHFHVKELLGNKNDALVPTIDKYAPLHFVSKKLPPICIITGDRKIEYPSRVEENDFFAVTLKNLGHPAVEFHEMPGVDHGGAGNAAAEMMEAFVRKSR